jgi:hypothetical protein
MFRLPYWLRNFPIRARGWKQELQAIAGLGFLGELQLTVTRADGRVEHLGVVSRRVVTDVGAQRVVDAFQALYALDTFNYHDSGTGNTAENQTDTALVAPAGPARVAGTKSEPASNQYRTVATITYAAAQTIAEHGLFGASTGAPLWDRSVFAGVVVAISDQIQFTYTLTVLSNG